VNNPIARVLIIDDEKMILDMLSQRLSRMGFEVDVAANAKGGINKIDTNQYDLIFTDIKMPGMSGDDVLEYVRSNVKKTIPVIAMSGTPWLAEKSKFDAFIPKPFYKEELLNVVRQFVQIA